MRSNQRIMNSTYNQEAASRLSIQDIFSLLLRRGWVLAIILSAALGLAYYITRITPKTWTATSEFIVTGSPPSLAGADSTTIATVLSSSLTTDMALIQTAQMASLTKEWLMNHFPDSPAAQASVDDIQHSLTVKNPVGTNLISVAVDWNNIDTAKLISDAICQAFLNFQTVQIQNSTNSSISNLKTESSYAFRQLIQAQNRLAAFKQDHNMANISQQELGSIGRYEDTQNTITKLQTTIASQKSLVASLLKRFQTANTSILKNNRVRDDAELTNALTQVAAAKFQYEQDRKIYTDKYPGKLSSDRNQIAYWQSKVDRLIKSTTKEQLPTLPEQAALQQQYQQEKTTLTSQQVQMSQLASNLLSLEGQVHNLPAIQNQYDQLNNSVSIASANYNAKATKLTQMQTSRDAAEPNLSIAQHASVPDYPTYPNVLLNMVFGGVAGLLLGFAVMMLMEYSDQRLRSLQTARALLPGPVIGALPPLSGNHVRALESGDPSGPIAEAYSLARANLALALRSISMEDIGDSQVVMVTSAMPGEGKSITAASLARSAARSGKNVVLVNADMRRPAMNRIFSTSEPHGLADVLQGAISLEDALVSSDTPNLTILHSGTPDRNPSDLLAMPKMAETIQTLRKERALIIIDTPPCSVVADSLVLAPLADCILQVVSLEMADQQTVLETTESLNASNPKKILFFINRCKNVRQKYHTNYYYGGGGPSQNGKSQTKKESAPRKALPSPMEAVPTAQVSDTNGQ